MKGKIRHIYGEKATVVLDGIKTLKNKYICVNSKNEWVDENDIMLITYGDSIRLV